MVTASRRAETVQELPASISVMTGDALQEAGITASTDVADQVPNVVFRSAWGFSQPQYYIRGLGNRNFQTNSVSPVAVYTDGVVMGSSLAQSFQVLDLERVEVLRGPQGTLYGRNASAGLLSFISRKPNPADGVNGSAELSYGRYNEISGNGALTVPINDRFAVRGAFAYRSRDGFFEPANPALGSGKVGDEESWQYRFTAGYFTDDVEVLARVRGGRINNEQHPHKQIGSLGPAPFCPSLSLNQTCTDSSGFSDSSNPYETFMSVIGTENARAIGTDVALTWHLSPTVSLYYQGAYDEAKNFRYVDEDFAPPNLLHITYRTRVHFTSQEMRLQSDTKGRFDWILGAYYYSENLNQWDGLMANGLGFGGVGAPLKQTTRSYAAFGNVVFRFNEQWNVRAGLRVTRDRRRGTSSSFLFDGTGLDFRSVERDEAESRLLFPFVPEATLTKAWTKPSGEITLSYIPSEALHVYAGYSVGFRGGDFNGGVFSPAETVLVDPEFTKNLEAGIKARSPGGAFSGNLTVFRTRITDQQVSSLLNINGSPALVLSNAASTRLEGIELDLAWKLGAGFSVRGSLGLLDAKFRSYPNAPGGGDFSGNRLAYAPKLTANAALRYDAAAAIGDVTAEVSTRYVSKQFDQPSNNPRAVVRPYGYVDAFIAWSPANASQWNFRIWGKNLTNREYYTTYFSSGGLGWNALGYADPRTFGVAVAYRVE